MARTRLLAMAALLMVLLLAPLGCTDSGAGGLAGPDRAEPTGSSGTARPLRLSQPRAVHRATLLADGRVLVTGGCTEPGCGGFDAGRRAELYDAGSGLVPDAEMASARASGTATLLGDGRVLLAGGYPGEGRDPTGSAEVYPRRLTRSSRSVTSAPPGPTTARR